jgi:two-component system, response regulator
MDNYQEVEILMIEDNKNDIELALRALAKRNLANKVFVVKDGAEALEFIFATGKYTGRDIKKKPKVILLDLKLPKVNGLEVLRKIKADEEMKLIPVVILTSSNEERDMIESYKLGANSYITKPMNFDKFAEIVATLGFYWLLVNQPPV